MSEARPTYPRAEDRPDRLEHDAGEIKTTLARLEPMIIRIDAMLPLLATRAEVAALDGKLSCAAGRQRPVLKSEIRRR